MKVQPECVPCLMKRVLYETNLVDSDKAYETLWAAARIFGEELGRGPNSAQLATKVHAEAYRILGDDDLYRKMKAGSNRMALKLLPHARRLVGASKDKFKSAVLCSIVGNTLDFGIDSPVGSPKEILTKFDDLYGEGLAWDDTGKMRKLLGPGASVLYFADNCGEIVFDTLLMERLKEFGVILTLVVRGRPILTDATLKDVKALGIDKLADEVETTGVFAVGVDFSRIPRSLALKLERADLIIAKGMANWESFSDEDYGPVAYLMRTKCGPVARGLGVRKDANVAKLCPRPPKR